MGICCSTSQADTSDKDKILNSAQTNTGDVEIPQSSESSTQPALTESVVQSVGTENQGGVYQVGGRRLSGEKQLEIINELRQESFHSAVSGGSYKSAVSKLSENDQQAQSALPVLKKKFSGKENFHHEGFPTDHIPNDELASFWQPMCLTSNSHLNDIGSYKATTNHGFQVVGHQVNIQQQNGIMQTIGAMDSLPKQNIDTSIQGSNVSEAIVFRISEPAKDLTCIKRVTKGVMQFTLTEYMGDYDVGEHTYEFPETTIPKGPFSRGQYHVVTTFVDTHGDELFSCVGDFKVVKQQVPKLPVNGINQKI